jgi:hypothetical protein
MELVYLAFIIWPLYMLVVGLRSELDDEERDMSIFHSGNTGAAISLLIYAIYIGNDILVEFVIAGWIIIKFIKVVGYIFLPLAIVNAIFTAVIWLIIVGKDKWREGGSWSVIYDGEDEVEEFPEKPRSIMPPRPPFSQIEGVFGDDGYEWLEHPTDSKSWYWRDSDTGQWKKH